MNRIIPITVCQIHWRIQPTSALQSSVCGLSPTWSSFLLLLWLHSSTSSLPPSMPSFGILADFLIFPAHSSLSLCPGWSAFSWEALRSDAWLVPSLPLALFRCFLIKEIVSGHPLSKSTHLHHSILFSCFIVLWSTCWHPTLYGLVCSILCTHAHTHECELSETRPLFNSPAPRTVPDSW